MRSKKSLLFALLTAGVLLALSLVVPSPAGAGDPPGTNPGDSPGTKVVAYYFHGQFRCATCRKLEALSKEAISSGFAQELGSSRLAFRVVNVETPDTEHFVKDFQLVTKSLVLVEYKDGKVVRWKNLPKIWQLVRDREEFIRYVQGETRAFLGER